MSSGQLVAHANLTFLGNIHLGHLENARRQLVADGDGELATLKLGIQQFVLADVIHDELLYQVVRMGIVGPVVRLNAIVFQVLERSRRELATLIDYFCTRVVFNALRHLVFGEFEEFVYQDVFEVFVLSLVFFVYLGKYNLVLFLRVASLNGTREQFLVDNNATERGVGFKRRVFNVAGLVAEDGTKEFFFGRGVALSLRRNLTDEDVAWFDTCTNAHHAVVVEVFGSLFAHVGDVAGKLFHTTFGFANVERILVYVNRSEHVVAHQAFRKHDGVFVVVTLPRHVSHEEVTTQGQFAILGGIAFGKDVACLNTLSLHADGAKVDGHVLVCTAELGYAVFFQCGFEAYVLFVFCTIV